MVYWVLHRAPRPRHPRGQSRLYRAPAEAPSAFDYRAAACGRVYASGFPQSRLRGFARFLSRYRRSHAPVKAASLPLS